MLQQTFNTAEKLQLLELVATVRPNGKRWGAASARLVHLLVNKPASRLWSSARLAIALGYGLRTIDRALAELRQAGVVECVRRRRGTMEKRICLAAALDGLRRGTAWAIATATKAIRNRRMFDPPSLAVSEHLGSSSAPWRTAGPASPALLRLLRIGKNTFG